MEKKYLIEFTHADGSVEEVELVTERPFTDVGLCGDC